MEGAASLVAETKSKNTIRSLTVNVFVKIIPRIINVIDYDGTVIKLFIS